MNNLLELLKNTDFFLKYVEIIKKYNDLPIHNPYQNIKFYEDNLANAIISCSIIEKNNNDELIVKIRNLISNCVNEVKRVGHAEYFAIIKKEGQDLVVSEKIISEFSISTDLKVPIPLLNEEKQTRYQNMAYIISTKMK